MRTRLTGAAVVMAFVLTAMAARADDPVAFHGSVDGESASNSNHPEPRLNWLAGQLSFVKNPSNPMCDG